MAFPERRLFKTLIICTGLTSGIAIGLGAYTFYYAKGVSYLSNNPAACANCHIMNSQYDAWLKGSHHSVATCNDCHSPKSFMSKYLSKAVNGFFHGYAFTTGRFHEPIQIKVHNRIITEQSCRRCHGELTHAVDRGRGLEHLSCIHCHRNVGHFNK